MFFFFGCVQNNSFTNNNSDTIIITIIYVIVSFKIVFWILHNHHHFTSSLIAVELHKVMQCIALWEGPCHGHYLFCSIVEGTIQRTNLHTRNWNSQIKWQ